MRTLYDFLKTEALDKLNNNLKEYPLTVEKTIEALKEKYSWVDLTVWEASQLCMYNDLPFNITNLKDLFY